MPMHIERIYQCAGFTYVSIKALTREGVLLEVFFGLSDKAAKRAQYFREWLFREFIYRGIEGIAKLIPRRIEKIINIVPCGGYARIEIVSCGTARLRLNWRNKMKWFWEWLKYKIRGR